MVRVRVDLDRCVGNGLCEAQAPELFSVGDDAISRVLIDELRPEQRTLAEEAIASCPSQALELRDE